MFSGNLCLSWLLTLFNAVGWNWTGHTISSAIYAGVALAVTAAIVDASGQTTRIDNGTVYFPYTVEKSSK